MARRPRYGCGKRRLAREGGELAAWRFQRFALRALLQRLGRDPRWRAVVAVTPDAAAFGPGRWALGLPREPQGSGDLGQRMLRHLAGAPRPGAVLLIGADIPGIEASSIAGAFSQLRNHDWVIGPATDGGYWAIGARRRPWRPADFSGIAWGGATVLEQTLSRLHGSVAYLEERADVDCLADLQSWGPRPY